MSATPPRDDGPTPSASEDPALSGIAGKSSQESHPRRSSFNFLRRQKSGENLPANKRKSTGGRMSKKQKALAAQELLRQQREAGALKQPPRLPSHSPLPQIISFGGEEERPDSVAIVSNRANMYGQNGAHRAADYKMGPSPHGAPVPAPPGSASGSQNGEYDPYARTESMTHRGRYSYANSFSSNNTPRRVRRRKDPTPFNILVVGTKNSGKTSFIEFLRNSLALPAKKRQAPSPPKTALPPDSPFTSYYLETEVESERIGVTLWDSQGLERNIVDLQLREMSSFLESKFEDTFAEEQKVVRAPGVRDTHIHCVFLILDPSRLDANIAAATRPISTPGKLSVKPRLVGILDEDLDLQVLRTMQGKTTVIPVISKADTITAAHMSHLKKAVWDSLKQAKLDPLEALNLSDEDDEDFDRLDERDEDEYNLSSSDGDDRHSDRLIDNLVDRSTQDADTVASSPPQGSPARSPSVKRPTDGHRRRPSAMSVSLNSKEEDELPYLPLSIISPDTYEPGVIGRRFPWGFADPYNVEHCDFVRLKESVFSEWRSELREASRERWYEGWRTSRLKKRTGGSSTPTKDSPGNGYANPGLAPSSVNGMTGPAGAVSPGLYRGVTAY